jgi:hypothetical protein
VYSILEYQPSAKHQPQKSCVSGFWTCTYKCSLDITKIITGDCLANLVVGLCMPLKIIPTNHGQVRKKLATGLTHAHVLASLPPTHANGGWPFKKWFCKFVWCCNTCNVWNLYKAQSPWSSYNYKVVRSLELRRSCIKRTFHSKPDRNYRAPISAVKSTTEALKTMGKFWHITC